MREGGIGGANTRTGANYEKVREDLTQFLQYSIKYIQPKDDRSHIYLRQGKEKKDNDIIANIYYKNEFYRKFLEPKQVNVNKILSKKLIPDVVVEVINTKFLGIIEIKNQNTTGTVDEKIQTCDFKQRQFKKLLVGTGYKFKFIYLLNDWFTQDRYKDDLDYIKNIVENCDYCINQIPNDLLDGLDE